MPHRRSDEDFSAEVQAHLDIEADRLRSEGLSAEDARAAARKTFGNATLVRERFHEASRWTVARQLAQDLRYAWRGLLHSPSFVATTVLTLAVGLAVVTVAFTVFDAYFLRPYAVHEPSRLHRIGWRSIASGGQSFRWRDFESIRERRDLFDAVVAEGMRFVSSNGRPLGAALISDNYFEMLRPGLRLGRALGAGDAQGGHEALVLSDQAWARLYARDPAALGASLDVNGRPFVIVGVLRPEFSGLSDMPYDAWILLPTYAALVHPELTAGDQPRAVELVARLRDGVAADQAQAALTPWVTEASAGLDDLDGLRADVRQQASPHPISPGLLAVLSPVFATFALVLLTACANVSNVMLARAIARQREIAVRLSLGAGRGRIVRQLMTEGLLVALLAGLAGILLASWVLGAGVAAISSSLPTSVADLIRIAPLAIDLRVFLFALAVATGSTVLFALVPALQASRVDLIGALRGHGSGAQRGSRLRGALVIVQVAVSAVLVITALTLARNGAAVGSIDLGYETDGVVSVNVRNDRDGLVARLAPALEADPRIAEIAVTGGNPLVVRTRDIAAAAEGGGTAVPTRFTFVSPEYFTLLRIPITRGRGFNADEARSAARVAIVSAATAAALWPGESPIGKIIRIEASGGRPVEDLPGYAQVTVVGATRDVVSGLLVDGLDAGHIYLPASERHPHASAILLRGRTPRDASPAALQEIFKRVVGDPEVFEALPVNEMRALQLYPLRAAAWVGGLLGLVALGLSVSGLYGVLSYAMSQRTREIGVRMALGATTGDVVRLVMRQSGRLAGVGALLGAAAAFAALMMLSSVIRLEAISLVDVTAFAAGLPLVLTVTALAACQPARRATRIDPASSLRSDV